MRKVLVVIDMQNDFIDGVLGTKEAVAIVDNVVEKIKGYNACDIYATRDTHSNDYLNTNEGKHLPVKHCIKGSEGWQINKKVAEALGEATIVDKPSFGSMKLAEILKAENEKEPLDIEIIGLCTDICVISNAMILKAAMPEVNISVNSSCCAGVTPNSHNNALEAMKMCQIEIIKD